MTAQDGRELPGRVAVALFADGGDLTFAALLDMVLDMTTITMRELMHNPTGVLRIVEHGGTVRLTRRGRPVARLVPDVPAKPGKVQMPDFAARARAYSGGFVMSDAAVKRMKDAEDRRFS